MDPDDRIAEASRRLSEALAPGDLDSTLGSITAAAVDVLPDVQHASITVKHARRHVWRPPRPPTDVLLDLDAAQYEFQEGPCYEAAVDTVHVISPHLAQDHRFPRYAPVAVAAGIRAQAGIRLFDAPASSGALNLYGVAPRGVPGPGDARGRCSPTTRPGARLRPRDHPAAGGAADQAGHRAGGGHRHGALRPRRRSGVRLPRPAVAGQQHQAPRGGRTDAPGQGLRAPHDVVGAHHRPETRATPVVTHPGSLDGYRSRTAARTTRPPGGTDVPRRHRPAQG